MKFSLPVISLTCALLLFLSGSAPAQPSAPAYFDEKITYDIYFSNSEGATIIKSVQILGFQEIGEKLFLVVQPNGFSLKDYEGYIRFDSIQAILPDRNFQVNDSSKKQR